MSHLVCHSPGAGAWCFLPREGEEEENRPLPPGVPFFPLPGLMPEGRSLGSGEGMERRKKATSRRKEDYYTYGVQFSLGDHHLPPTCLAGIPLPQEAGRPAGHETVFWEEEELLMVEGGGRKENAWGAGEAGKEKGQRHAWFGRRKEGRRKRSD